MYSYMHVVVASARCLRVITTHGNGHPSKFRPLPMYLNGIMSNRDLDDHGYTIGATEINLLVANYMHVLSIYCL
jgi:hypothetical protein